MALYFCGILGYLVYAFLCFDCVGYGRWLQFFWVFVLTLAFCGFGMADCVALLVLLCMNCVCWCRGELWFLLFVCFMVVFDYVEFWLFVCVYVVFVIWIFHVALIMLLFGLFRGLDVCAVLC